MYDLAVIGAGISGLTSAYYAQQAGWRVALIEADKVGGLINTVQQGGFTLECGPNVILAKNDLRKLAADLGLDGHIVRPRYRLYRQHVYYGGRLERVPKDPFTWYKTPLVAQERKWPIIKIIFSGSVPSCSADDCSVAEFLAPLLGAEAVDRMLLPALRGIYGSSPYLLSARTIFPKLWEAGQAGLRFREYLKERRKDRGLLITLQGGLQLLVERLEIECSKSCGVVRDKVLTLQPLSDGFQLVLGSGERVQTKRVLVSTSGAASAEYLNGLAPEVSQILARQEYVPIVVVHFSVPQASRLPEKSFGVLFPPKSGQRIMGVMFNSLLFPHLAPAGQHLLTVMLGGNDDREILELHDQQIEGAARADLRAVLGLNEVSFLKLTRYERAIPVFKVGHFQTVAALRELESEYRGLVFCGTDIGQPGIADRVTQAKAAVNKLLHGA